MYIFNRIIWRTESATEYMVAVYTKADDECIGYIPASIALQINELSPEKQDSAYYYWIDQFSGEADG